VRARAEATLGDDGEEDQTAANQQDQRHEGHQRDRLLDDGVRVDRHAGGDEEDRDEETERQPLELVLQALVALRNQLAQHESRGERTENGVEVERRGGHRQRHQQQHDEPHLRLAGRLGATTGSPPGPSPPG
jgi:hypothetical protein